MGELVQEKLNILIQAYEKGLIHNQAAIDLCDLLEQEEEHEKDRCAKSLFDAVQNNAGRNQGVCIYAYIYSVIFSISPKQEYVLEFLNNVLEDDELTWENLHFLYHRLNRLMFMNPTLGNIDISVAIWRLLRKILNLCMMTLNYDLRPIPANELTGNTQLIITSQFLSPEHGPTKTALDRASVLSKYGEVLILNTAEMLPSVGAVPYLCDSFSQYKEELLEAQTVEWKGKTFGYFQCEQNMPNGNAMGELLSVIRDIKPRFCICIGGDSLFAGLVNEMIPTVTVGTTQSSLACTLCDYQVVDQYQLNLNRELIKRLQYERNIIEGKFTFSLIEESDSVLREDYQLTKDDFVICMVGARLSEEITDDLWEAFSELSDKEFKIMLIGGYAHLDKVYQKYPKLISKIINVGFCTDARSRIRLCDLYVNPIRKGGATSAVEAMTAGLPVLTVNFGDVAGTVGKDFWCNSIDQYSLYIKKYIEDSGYYNKQKMRALDAANVLLDSEKEFERILSIYLEKEAQRN